MIKGVAAKLMVINKVKEHNNKAIKDINIAKGEGAKECL